ncbi:MAG: GH3 auxin-responsive promoter family protein [Thermoflexibacter sp.]|nr:GH3 auxin-responsive promoter family protein [Thermoflexibacter sp.]
MEWLNTLLAWLMKRRFSQIERFMLRPHEVQEELFKELITSAKNTEWGKKYGYKDIAHPLHFKERVPVSSYEQLYPYIERMMKGEQNVLWASEIKCFSKSSGTTNARSKFIPVSEDSLEECHYKGGKDLLCLYVNNYPDTKIFQGKNLGIGGSYQQNPLNAQTYYGDISALIMKNLPIWAEFLRTPSLDIALMDKWEEKIEKIAQTTIYENVTAFSGVPTWTIVILQRILEITGKSNICEVWENVEAFFHGAVAFAPYKPLFKGLIPSEQMNYMETYNASEGFFGIQDQKNSDELLLMLDYGVYYEFIPIEEFEKDYPKTIGLEQVEIGKNYAMVISTNAGLWRYKIGDTVRFTSLSPFRIKITGRTKHFINAFGEEVVIENADTAIEQACLQTNATVNDYTAAPIFLELGNKGGHEWIIEFEQVPRNLDTFVHTLDSTLRQVNSDYDAKRYMDIALVMPTVHAVPKGTFYDWMKKRGKLGGQNKVPRLSNSREYVEDILQDIKKLNG